jgi:hypothetical protein
MDTVDSSTLRLRVSKTAHALFTRVQQFLKDTVSDGTFYTLHDDERPAAAELVDRGVCFYSMDVDHIGCMRHSDVFTDPTVS